MAKYYSLFGGTTTDTEIQVVKENQIVIGEYCGATSTRLVVSKVEHTPHGYMYHLINIRSKEYHTTDIITPLSKKFGIGTYYDEINPEFMDAFEVAILREEAEHIQKEEREVEDRENERKNELRAIGRERLKNILPANAKAVIVGCERQDDSDSQTDYFSYSTIRTVILGFSFHTKNLFSEMRSMAGNFEETKYLSEKNPDYEHRENYSMGAGYYLGESKYRGWIIEKNAIYTPEKFIENYALSAGNEDNIHLKKTDTTPPSNNSRTGKNACTLVEYSAKAVAVFGDTKSIKDELKAMGGRFNSHLTFNGKRLAGWIFSKSQEQQLACYFGLD